MTKKRNFGLINYLLLSQDKRDFYDLTGRLPNDEPDRNTIELDPKLSEKSKGGRPRLKFHVNEKRAYHLWSIAKELPREQRISIKNRELIEIAKKSPSSDLFTNMTSQATLEQSISRGKKTLKIDKHWNSKLCDLLEQDIHKRRS